MMQYNHLEQQPNTRHIHQDQSETKIICYPSAGIAIQDTIKRIIQCVVRENLFEWSVRNQQLIIHFPKSNQKLIAENVQLFHFSRLNLLGDILLQSSDVIESVTVEKLMKLLSIELTNVEIDKFEQFTSEVTNNIVNTGITLRQDTIKNKLLKSLARNNKCNTVYDLVEKLYYDDHVLYFEQFASRGHPFHPGNKTKLGFNSEEVFRFCPEFNPTVDVLICAIHKQHAAYELESDSIDYLSWFNSHYPKQLADWKAALHRNFIVADDYLPIPVHPWQAEHMLPKVFHNLLRKKQLIILDKVTLPSRPSLSFRTLMPTATNIKFQIKLPVAVQATSALRTVSPASIHNSPQISRVLRKILEQESPLNKKLIILMDSIGVRVNDDNSERAKHLSAIYRDNVEQFLSPGEMAIVTSALFQRSPISNCAIIAEMINSTSGEELQTHCLSYFQNLSKLLIDVYLSLYIKYGIAMEVHQQNTFIVFKDKVPVKTIIRDMGGLRIHHQTLKDKGYKLNPFSDSATITNDLNEVRNKLQHTLYQCQFNELIVELSQYFGINENAFWAIIAEQTKQCLDILGGEVAQKVIDTEVEAFFQEEWPVKSLLSMRLCGAYNKYVYSKAPNPLAIYKSDIKC